MQMQSFGHSPRIRYTFMCAVIVLGLLFSFACGFENLVQGLFPPEDLYEPLGTVDADLALEGSTVKLEWTNKYRGMHSIVLAVENSPPEAVAGIGSYTGGLRGSIVVFFEGRVIKEASLGSLFQPFWGGNGFRGGFRLLRFDVPEDLKTGRKFTCLVTVETGGRGFHEKYGETKLAVIKDSDL